MATGVTVRPAEATTLTVDESLALRRATLWALLGSKVLSGWGTMWDIQWHVLIGRDSFWIAPHVMIYAGVTLSVFLCFGLLAWETWLEYRGARPRDAIRVLGLMGTRGFHLAAWGIAITVLAAPVDDLWHRLFGIDVTLWSPPHLMGIFGGTVNALGCLVIAREVYPAGSFPGITGAVLGGAFVYGGLDLVLRPAIRIAYLYGGVRFYTFAVLGALLLPLALIVTARVSRMRWAPLGLLLVLLPIGVAGNAVARAGFAWLQPVSFIEEQIAKDPGAPIAVAHAIARKEGTTPGQLAGALSLVGIVPAAVMVVADPRRRPLAATLAYSAALFAAAGWFLAGRPALAPMRPDVTATLAAFMLTLLAGIVAALLASRLAHSLVDGR